MGSISSTFGGVTTTLASNITYKPIGGITGLTYGNGLACAISYDNQYRPTSITTGALQSLSYSYDGNANITAITNNLDNTKNKSYSYDALDRLTGGTGPWGTVSWTYDPVGNRLTQADNTGTSTYVYQPGSNRLATISGAIQNSFSYDANGNMLAESTKQYSYNQGQRLIHTAATKTGDYVYNALGQRVKKTVAGVVTYYIFDKNGQLIYETASDGTQAEYIYLNDQPLAKIDVGGTNYIHTDQLGTSVMMTDASGAKVWGIEASPFGDAATIVGTASFNFRYPGQYYDSETGNNYNYFRDYNPAIGSYVEADPIGLPGGINSFIYVQNNPINFRDPTGLNPYAEALGFVLDNLGPIAEYVTTWAQGQVAIPGGPGKLDAAKFIKDKLFPDSPPSKYEIPPVPPGWTIDPTTGLLIPPKGPVCEMRR
ncbi:MAG TPA: RHS repeat-associated core domain-containing protein [Geobacteraceae bacterium]